MWWRPDTLPGSTGITIVGARAYLPATGEFLTADPVIDSGQNLYGYTDGDPINARDTSGNESETDWTWVWIAVGTAALSIALGVTLGGRGVSAAQDQRYNLLLFKEVGLHGKASKWFQIKGALRAAPTKGIVAGAMVLSGVAAGVATGMALRNQVSETWQAVAIGVGAAVATLGLGYGAGYAVGKARLARQVRAARLRQARQSTAHLSTSSTVRDSVDTSLAGSIRNSGESGGDGAFILRKADRYSSGDGANPVFNSQSGGRISVKDL